MKRARHTGNRGTHHGPADHSGGRGSKCQRHAHNDNSERPWASIETPWPRVPPKNRFAHPLGASKPLPVCSPPSNTKRGLGGFSAAEIQCLKASKASSEKLRLESCEASKVLEEVVCVWDLHLLTRLEEAVTMLSCKVCKKAYSAMLGHGNLGNNATPGQTLQAKDVVSPVVLSCGHVFCGGCMRDALVCPHCRANIVGKQKVFFL